MQTIVYIAGIATMLATMSSVGVVLAMILGAIVAGVGGLVMAQSEVREIKSRVVHQQQSNAERQSELPTGSRTIACPSCKIGLLFRDVGELQCRCPQCKTTFCLDAGNRIYDIKLEQLAESSHAKTQAKRGETHHEGAIIQEDHQKAATLLSKAADQGRASAQYHLGTLHMQGKGVAQDDVQAAEWLRKAADQGHADAQGILGTLYTHGHGVPQDYEQAAVWFRKAAGQGVADAQNNLGILYRESQGVPQDFEQAAMWFRKAARQGLAVAECNLGLLYSNGQGVPRDIIEACKWFHLACGGGFSGALKYREFSEKMLTTEQIAEARRRASFWMIELLKSTGVQVTEEVVNSPNTDIVTSKSSANHRIFCFANGETLTPQEYGINAIKLSLEGSENAIKEIVGSNESRVQQEISAHRGPVQLHLIALQAAAFYVCANTLSSSNHDVLTDIAGGIADGFAAIMGEYHSDDLYDIYKDYGHLLAEELEKNNFDNFMDMGVTANLVVKNLSGQCNIDKILADNPIEKIRIEEIVRRNGIGLLLMLLAHRGITYTA